MSINLLDQVEQSLGSGTVGIEEFCESTDYCDKPLYPRQRVLLKLIFLEELTGAEEDILDLWLAGGRNGSEIQISPNIRERVQYLRDNGFRHFKEIGLAGGRRSSKGHITGLALAKIMWETLLLRDPGKHYGIDPDKNIEFACVAVSEAQAKERQYADFSSAIESCKAFEPYLLNSLETEFRVATGADLQAAAERKRKGIKLDKVLARLRGKAYAANAGSIRGAAMMALVLDEVAHMIPGESKAAADQVYSAGEPSLAQFGKDAICFLNSSPYSKVGLFYEKFEAAMRPYDPSFAPLERIGVRENTDPQTFAIRYPSWGLYEGYDQDPQGRFAKAIMVSPDWNITEQPYLSKDDLVLIDGEKAKEAANPETYRVEYRSHFAEVIDSYLNPAMVDRIFMGRPNGFDEEGRPLLLPYDTNWGTGATNLYKYKMHLDPSSTTAGFGFALAHTERIEEPTGDGGSRIVEHVVFDIVKRWNPADFPGHTIDWKVVIQEVIGYADLFRPFEITFDQHQSVEPIQTLKYALMEKGIEGCQVFEVTATLEHNWFRAETFKTALNHGLIHAPNDTDDLELASNELKFLQQRNTGGRHPRVDKQDLGPVQTKDMADSMFECVDTLIGNILAQTMRERAVSGLMAVGAPGGFRIGGNQQPSLAELHPNLAGYYQNLGRIGEQSKAGYNTMPVRGAVGGAARGMNRGVTRSRGRTGRRR